MILPDEPKHEMQYMHDKNNEGKNIHKTCIFQQCGQLKILHFQML